MKEIKEIIDSLINIKNWKQTIVVLAIIGATLFYMVQPKEKQYFKDGKFERRDIFR